LTTTSSGGADAAGSCARTSEIAITTATAARKPLNIGFTIIKSGQRGSGPADHEEIMEKIIVTAKFHTGHRQLGYPGKCKFVHGHTWHGKVTITADQFPRDDIDMSLEFGAIKNVMRFMDHKMLVVEADKTFLNSQFFEPEGVVILKGKGPSVENVALYVFEGVVDVIKKQYPGKNVRYTIEVMIQETENNVFIVEKSVTI
jgi:6-pyruvoyltetrahydropterin/6-carboxytetrahydropterin synthase